MSERTHLLVQQWLQQAMPHASTNDLSAITEKFPYFSAAQLLLFRRLNGTDGTEHKGKAALHVYNPLLLETVDETKMFDFPFSDDIGVETIEPETETQKEKETFFEEPEENLTNASEPVIEVENVKENEEENLSTQPDEIAASSIDTIESGPETEDVQIEKIDEKPQQEQPEPTEPALSVSLPKFDLNAPPVAPAGDITFEPYHTVDYFASQGIKLSQTDTSGDKFGKQLKSFTEWLKTMKKLPATAITANTDNAGEKKVENLAAHSLQNADIVTESMAEVWVKQGNMEKASEVYNKLSLQNPSKKAYFAAKIESLKKPSKQ